MLCRDPPLGDASSNARRVRLPSSPHRGVLTKPGACLRERAERFDFVPSFRIASAAPASRGARALHMFEHPRLFLRRPVETETGIKFASL